MRLLFLVGSFVICASNTMIVSGQSFQSEQEDSDRPMNNANGLANGHSKGYAQDEYGSIEISNRSARMLFLEAEQTMRSGDSAAALRKVKHSLAIDNDDIDAHLLYAQLLEEKLRGQTERDPSLFNQCVEEWLNIMRNRYGDEKGMRYKGINPCGDLFNDEERSITAKRALTKLTGYAPKTFETDNHYMKRVSMPYSDKVSGAIVGHKPKGQTE
jgi:hypothetical protein